MKNKSLTRTILLIVLALFIVIQFFPIQKENPPINLAQDYIQTETPPKEVVNLLKVACYDCHAHTTTYPWYTNIQPVGWWIKGHINNGRKKLNFSKWTAYDAKKKAHNIEECMEVIEDKKMPALSYMIAHREAWLDDDQRKILVDWFKQQR